mmetsp:Transcript_17616/g.27436  ORF Transcript_17616/g.27436 Transcript_17616/m.27436 type:complete len:94 (-) Transcript_17616:455-736(-)
MVVFTAQNALIGSAVSIILLVLLRFVCRKPLAERRRRKIVTQHGYATVSTFDPILDGAFDEDVEVFDDDDDIEDNRIEMKSGDNFLTMDEVNG